MGKSLHQSNISFVKMRKATGFLLASLAFVTLAAVLAITLRVQVAEKEKRRLSLASTTEKTEFETEETTVNLTVTEDYESSTHEILTSPFDLVEENSTHEVYHTIYYHHTTHIVGEYYNTTDPTPTAEETRCSEMTGKFVNGKFVGLEIKYDLEKIIEMHGGAPGKVNVTWTEKDDPPLNTSEIDMRPLPDADEEYWIYKYKGSDAKTYVRTEHAVRRFSGTPRAFLEIRGGIHFTPDDFCGYSRRASYTVDDRGFTFEVSREYCRIEDVVSCASPMSCVTDERGRESCASAPSHDSRAAITET